MMMLDPLGRSIVQSNFDEQNSVLSFQISTATPLVSTTKAISNHQLKWALFGGIGGTVRKSGSGESSFRMIISAQ